MEVLPPASRSAALRPYGGWWYGSNAALGVLVLLGGSRGFPGVVLRTLQPMELRDTWQRKLLVARECPECTGNRVVI